MTRRTLLLITTLMLVLVARMGAYEPRQLQEQYVLALQGYLDAPYVWGGESRRGIDCSGLVRAAFIETSRKIAKSYWRPDIWWQYYDVATHDFHARDIANDPNRFYFVDRVENLNTADLKNLQPGDLAVLESGTHVMAYLGHGAWIEANGAQKKVIRVQLPADSVPPHYAKPIAIYRWKAFL